MSQFDLKTWFLSWFRAFWVATWFSKLKSVSTRVRVDLELSSIFELDFVKFDLILGGQGDKSVLGLSLLQSWVDLLQKSELQEMTFRPELISLCVNLGLSSKYSSKLMLDLCMHAWTCLASILFLFTRYLTWIKFFYQCLQHLKC